MSMSRHSNSKYNNNTSNYHPDHHFVTAAALVPDDETLPIAEDEEDAPFDCQERDQTQTQDISSTGAVERPVKISVVDYKEVKEAVSEAISSVQQLTERIAREKEADLKGARTASYSYDDDSVYIEESESEQPARSSKDACSLENEEEKKEEKEEPEIVVQPSRSFAKDEEESVDSSEEESVESSEEKTAATTKSSKPFATNKSSGGVLSYFYPSFISNQSRHPTTMSSGKTRVAERLTAASNKPTDVNRSGELDHLKEKFDAFIKQFKPLIATLKNYHAAIIHLELNRSEVLQMMEAWSKDTPLYDTAGSGNVVVAATPAWAKNYKANEQSYCSMERQMSALNNKYAEQLLEYVIEYVQEWEIVVTTRVKSNIKQAEDLRKDLHHYDKKVKGLVDAEQKVVERGKTPTDPAKEKLKRNQEKLDMARQEFDKYATSVCHVIDSALQLAWMDMTPVVYRLANMEYDRLGGKNAEAFTKSLNELVQKLKDLAKEFEINTAMPEQVAKPAPPSATKPPPPAPKTPTRTRSSDSSSANTTPSKSNESSRGAVIEDPKPAPKSPKRNLFGGGGNKTPEKSK